MNCKILVPIHHKSRPGTGTFFSVDADGFQKFCFTCYRNNQNMKFKCTLADFYLNPLATCITGYYIAAGSPQRRQSSGYRIGTLPRRNQGWGSNPFSAGSGSGSGSSKSEFLKPDPDPGSYWHLPRINSNI